MFLKGADHFGRTLCNFDFCYVESNKGWSPFLFLKNAECRWLCKVDFCDPPLLLILLCTLKIMTHYIQSGEDTCFPPWLCLFIKQTNKQKDLWVLKLDYIFGLVTTFGSKSFALKLNYLGNLDTALYFRFSLETVHIWMMFLALQ